MEESYGVEDFRMYECRTLYWDPAIRFDFLNGDPVLPPPRQYYFNIRVILKEHYCHVSNHHINNNNNRAAHTNTTTHDFFNIPRPSIKGAIDFILYILNIAEENRKSMAHKILDYAKGMRNYEKTRALYMMVVVNVDIFYHNCDRVIETSLKDQACKLKMVELEEEEGLSDCCTICWEDLKVDTVQLPCSHFFHGTCIVNWLLRKNNCPLCRFQISFSDDY